MCKTHSCLNNILASAIIFLAAITLIVLMFLLACKVKRHEVLPEHIVIELKTDSKLSISSDDRVKIVDSLNAIMLRIEQLLANKYQYVLQKTAFEDSIVSMGSVIVGLVIAILGFFGLKSFQSIEDKAKLIAERMAESETKKYLANTAKAKVKEVIDEKFLKEISDIVTESIKDGILADIGEDIDNVNSLMELMKTNNQELQELKKQIAGESQTSHEGCSQCKDIKIDEAVDNPFKDIEEA